MYEDAVWNKSSIYHFINSVCTLIETVISDVVLPGAYLSGYDVIQVDDLWENFQKVFHDKKCFPNQIGNVDLEFSARHKSNQN